MRKKEKKKNSKKEKINTKKKKIEVFATWIKFVDFPNNSKKCKI